MERATGWTIGIGLRGLAPRRGPTARRDRIPRAAGPLLALALQAACNCGGGVTLLGETSPADTARPEDIADGGGRDASDDGRPDADGEAREDGEPEDGGGGEASVCGNGTIEPGEECEGDPPRACVTACGSAGRQACADCRWEASCLPPAEECNGRDDDCDGVCDDGFACCAGTRTPCAEDPADCGARTCSASCVPDSCAPAPPETCNGADDDCDGRTDEGLWCRLVAGRRRHGEGAAGRGRLVAERHLGGRP